MTQEAYIFPLSFAQQRLWFLDQLSPGNSFYNLPLILHLKAPIDTGALERSLNEITRRHEVLRTTFAVADGQPVQIISPALTLSLPVIDLRHLPEGERGAVAQRLADEGAWQPFDLSRGPLLRASLLRLGPFAYVLLLTLHHIVADDWSMRILHEELTTLYNAFAAGLPSPLPELPIQYADYAVWQRDWLQGEALESQLAYWRRQLAGLTPLELPTDNPRPAVQSFRGASHLLKVLPPLAAALQALSQRRGVTLFMTLLAAFLTLLHRYTGQDDLVLGLPVAGRNIPEVERIIGFFVNTLVLRADLSGDPTFLELLGRVREVALNAYANQDLPFEMIVEELKPERDLSHNPLFQVTFQLLNMPPQAGPVPDAGLETLEINKRTSSFDLAITLWEGPEGITGRVEYSTDLFNGSTIEGLTAHFVTLLEGVATGPGQRLSQLPLLTRREEEQILFEWNNTSAPFPHAALIQQLFEAVVERRPDAVAVAFEGGVLTYRELNRRANRLARHLRGLGVGPEVLVGICLERSPEMLVGLLAVLKAGGAYMPLDPAYPKNRLAYMMEDSRAAVVLTQSRLAEKLAGHNAQTVCLDLEREVIASRDDADLTCGASAEDMAYVIYTSGSTGRPKGVVIRHLGLCNVAEAQMRLFGVRPEDVVLQFASFSFDASTSEIFMTLLAGATLYVGSQDSLLPGPALMQLLREQAVTTATLAPSVLTALPAEELSTLRTIIAAGEACTSDVAALCGTGRKVFNAYGPSEATICATVAECAEADRKPPIGRPIANTQVYLLDSRLRPVPVGIPGELYIGGVGLARGYLNRPALTAAKFIPHPFSRQAGARLYRTGDLARYLPDGNIEFLGRVDHQVKIRGFRVELEEIEAVLAQHPSVQQAMVVVHEKTPNDFHLQARVVLRRASGGLSATELRGYLREHLPQYMIPSSFVFQDALPLLPNGKLDRRAGPEALQEEPEASYIAPASELERLISKVWQEVLGLEKVSTKDNFFDLGGHSLLMVKVHSQLKELLNRELKMTDLLNYPTISSLSQFLKNGRGDDSAQDRIQSRVERQKEAAHRRGQSAQEGQNG